MSSRRETRVALTALLLAVALSGRASAQSATIRGRIVDEQGKAISGATLSDLVAV